MKSTLKYFVLLLFSAGALILSAAEQPLGNVRKNGIIDVKTPGYSLSFFPGSMFPFRPGVSGAAIAEPYWLDRLCGEDDTWYFLRVERYAKQEILANTPGELKIRITGNFCFDDDRTAPGLPQAIYTYTCTPEMVTLSVTLRNPEKKCWKEVYLVSPAWQRHAWKNFASDQSQVTAAAEQIFPAKESASVGNPQQTITLFSGAPMLFTNLSIPVTPVVKRDLFAKEKTIFTGLCGAKLTDWSDPEVTLPEIKLQIKETK